MRSSPSSPRAPASTSLESASARCTSRIASSCSASGTSTIAGRWSKSAHDGRVGVEHGAEDALERGGERDAQQAPARQHEPRLVVRREVVAAREPRRERLAARGQVLEELSHPAARQRDARGRGEQRVPHARLERRRAGDLHQHIDRVPGAGARRADAERDDARVAQRRRRRRGRAPHRNASGQQGERVGAHGRVTEHDELERPGALPRPGEREQRRLDAGRHGLGREAGEALLEEQRGLARREQRARGRAAPKHRRRAPRRAPELLRERVARGRHAPGRAHRGRAVDEQHVVGRSAPGAVGLGQREPQEPRDRQHEQVRERVPEALHEDARARLLHRLAPEERRHDRHLAVPHAQPLQQVERARQQPEAGEERGHAEVREGHTARLPVSKSVPSCGTTSRSASRRRRPWPRLRAKSASVAWKRS
jgi:hypothetical protein